MINHTMIKRSVASGRAVGAVGCPAAASFDSGQARVGAGGVIMLLGPGAATASGRTTYLHRVRRLPLELRQPLVDLQNFGACPAGVGRRVPSA